MLWQFIVLGCVFGFIALVFLVHRFNYKRRIIVKIDEGHDEYTETEAEYLFCDLFRSKFKCIESNPDKLRAVFVRHDYKKFRKKDYFEKEYILIHEKHGIHITFQ